MADEEIAYWAVLLSRRNLSKSRGSLREYRRRSAVDRKNLLLPERQCSYSRRKRIWYAPKGSM